MKSEFLERKNFTKASSMVLALAIVLNGLGVSPKKKEAPVKEEMYISNSLRSVKIGIAKKFLELDEEKIKKEVLEIKKDIKHNDVINIDLRFDKHHVPSDNEDLGLMGSNGIAPQYDGEIILNEWDLPITNLVLDESVLVSNEEKIAWILEHFNLTLEQFNIIKATCRHEGGPGYFDGFTIINNIYNRTISNLWSPREEQRNLYNQTIRSGQYYSYLCGYYEQFLDLTPEECPAVQAVIDFLYYKSTGVPVIVHTFLNFSADLGYTFTTTGINFARPMEEDDFLTRDFICISAEQLREIAELGGFANYYLSQFEAIGDIEFEETENKYVINVPLDNMKRSRRLKK